jgi:hypothetical protein
MQKDELIQFHTFLLELKSNLGNIVDNNGGKEFLSYDKLNILPNQVYKSKREHRVAIFTLSEGIATLLANNNFSGFEKTSKRLNQMTEHNMTDKEKELIKP